MVQRVSKVPFTLDSVGKCQCLECPVQSKSQCVIEAKAQLNEALKKTPLNHEEVPGVYCAAGSATCTDLDPEQRCICAGCIVFSQYNLAKGTPAGYFCKHGPAQ